MNKYELKKKIIIGTANFTQKYGADPKKISHKEIKKILNLAKENGIYKIDTAEAYLKNKGVFKNVEKKFKFLSKITPDPRWVSLEFCQTQLENHFKVFNKNKVETLFFHNMKILFTKNGLKIFKNLELLKKKKYFQKIGLSIYDTNCLDFITTNYNFDVVQCPYNILDKRILTSGWFDKLKDQGIEIHIRSVFLQGLLVNKLVYKKKHFNKWKNLFFEWFQYLENNNISPIDYCLNNLMSYDFDQIIIGINSYNNLNEIINFKEIKKNIKLIDFKLSDTKLIDPRKWK
jgi:aryl-alcohol dehydrogenase-like predicted oxidoreductase